MNKKDEHLPFIKTLYESIKLKALPLSSKNKLFRGAKISNEEVSKIKHYLKNKIEDLPAAIEFSKSFLSFSKKEEVVKDFLDNVEIDDKFSKVLYVIEKDKNIDYSLSLMQMSKKYLFYQMKKYYFSPFLILK